MKTLKNGRLFMDNTWVNMDVVIQGQTIYAIGKDLTMGEVIDCKGGIIVSSFMDPHVHFRQPGYEYKETIRSGTKAAAAGGYTRVFMMPNLKPAIDDVASVESIIKVIKSDACIEAIPIAAITKGQKGEGELVDFASIAPYTIGFSDDGKGIKSARTMYEAMLQAKACNKPIIAHCEEEDLLYQGYIRKGIYSEKNQHKGILGIVETTQLARDLVLALETHVHLHVCHVSTKQSVDLIRFYKGLGCHVTCEVSPHHLLLTEEDLQENGNYKMNPPLGSREDKEALIQGLLDGTIDCIATDHAPHADHEKVSLKDAMFGIVGLETAFPLLYTHLVKTHKMTLPFLLEAMSKNVATIFRLPHYAIEVGSEANITVIDLDRQFVIDSSTFHSKSKNQPFEGMSVSGKIIKTVYKGGVVYEESEIGA